jgi:hypothetical protein
LNIDIDHIGDRQMSRVVNHAFALVVALMLTAASFNALISIPTGATSSPVEIA